MGVRRFLDRRCRICGRYSHGYSFHDDEHTEFARKSSTKEPEAGCPDGPNSPKNKLPSWFKVVNK
jgi:hypothetical protein